MAPTTGPLGVLLAMICCGLAFISWTMFSQLGSTLDPMENLNLLIGGSRFLFYTVIALCLMVFYLSVMVMSLRDKVADLEKPKTTEKHQQYQRQDHPRQ